ncbi:DNA/RNA helicase domain-containing protein [Enterococcus faecalis]|uniref:DNA/RNA helicase domain-containing protein n=1 Tax=Enterococcus faecalis TaxID=1351 RepID=UPI00032FA61B|nr:DNA/RNA helicase domain-containing protein [Enterococcus faecalis]EOJ20340.1 hypothetical protein UMS_00481 [Enterococcus faecalis EnGen0287]
MKGFTLKEFVSVYKEATNNIEFTLKYHQMKAREHELEDYYILCEEIIKEIDDDIDIDGWYLGTDIKVVPDFDILRYTDKVITNIELKHSTFDCTDQQRLKRKFKSQKHILQLFGIKFNNFIFFSENKELYKYLIEEDCFEKITIEKFIELIDINSPSQENKINKLTPKEYLISPLEDIEKFFNGVYYLTQQQQKIVDEIINKNGIFGVTGIPGSGKTLVAYDLLRRIDTKCEALMIFCGKIRKQHEEMERKFNNVHFVSAKDVNEEILNIYDYIIIDEAQRMYRAKFNLIRSWGEKNKQSKKTVFFFDCDQTLSPKDIGNMLKNYFQTLENDGKGTYLKLSGNIRSNKYIASFVKQLQNLNKEPKKDIDILKLREKIEVRFFKSADLAKPWIKSLQSRGYTFIAPTGDNYNAASADSFYDVDHTNTHNIIGSEMDYIVTYIDNNIEYTSQGILTKSNQEYYFLEKEIYVNISRAREKLALAIIGNYDVYSAIIEVIFQFKIK